MGYNTCEAGSHVLREKNKGRHRKGWDMEAHLGDKYLF